MKKIGFRFTKKGIIALALLLVLLAGAIYLHIKLDNDQTSVMDVIGKEDETGKLEPVDAKVYNDYFINFRSERNNIRAQEIDYLRSSSSEHGTDKETLDYAQNRLLELVNNMEQ